MEHKINVRVILLIILAVIITAVGVTSVYYNIFQEQIKKDLKTHSEVLVDFGYFESAYKKKDYDYLEKKFKNIKNTDLRITWIDKDGTVLYDSLENAKKLSNHKDRPEIKQAFKTGSGEILRKSDTVNTNTFYYAKKISNGTVLRVATEVVSKVNIFLSALPMIILILIIELLICMCISHWLTKQIVAPIEDMAEHLDDSMLIPPYKELSPFADKIRAQHDYILSAAKHRQDFSANVSHELKTPLTAITGYAELIENNMIDSKRYPEFAKKIRHSATNLLKMINNIISLSSFDNDDAEFEVDSVDMKEVVETVIDGLMITANQNNISLTSDIGPAVISGNKDMLEELAVNIIQNAIRYNNPGGYVNVILKNENNRVVFIVSDNGIGMSKKDKDRMFERFYRADKSRARSRGGSGIGLSIVKHVIELHGAEVNVESELGKGTTFKVTF